MARSHQTAQTGPDWPPARTRDLLKRQLEELQKFRGQTWRDVEHEEDEWQQFTTKEPPQINLNKLTESYTLQRWPVRRDFVIGC